MGRSTDLLLALAGGLLLALMIDYNSLLAKHSTPLFASWVAHGIGSVVAFFLVAVYSKVFRLTKPEKKEQHRKVPLWSYLGGIPGALLVVLAAITVNSSLGLSGTIALMLVGQVLFGIISDHFGLFGIPKKSFTLTDTFVVSLVFTGSGILIFFR